MILTNEQRQSILTYLKSFKEHKNKDSCEVEDILAVCTDEEVMALLYNIELEKNKQTKTMILSNKELKVLAIETLHPISNIAMVSIDEIWKIEGKHYRELTVWEKGGSVSDEIIASIKVDDSFNSDQVKHLLLAEVDYLEEFFLEQNK